VRQPSGVPRSRGLRSWPAFAGWAFTGACGALGLLALLSIPVMIVFWTLAGGAMFLLTASSVRAAAAPGALAGVAAPLMLSAIEHHMAPAALAGIPVLAAAVAGFLWQTRVDGPLARRERE
jgi:hypothetical protein